MKLQFGQVYSILTVMVAFCAVASAQTLDIGSDLAEPGQSISLPVTLTVTADCTAALLRIEYDDTVLENPSVTAGTLVSGSHSIDSYAPEIGRFNISVYADSGAPDFMAQTGTLVNLTFDIKADAPPGNSPIAFTTSGAPDLPAT